MKKKVKKHYVPKKLVESGQFPIRGLKAYSIVTDTKIIIPRYAEIEKGKIKYIGAH